MDHSFSRRVIHCGLSRHSTVPVISFFATLATSDTATRAAVSSLTVDQRGRLSALYAANHDVVWRVLRRFALNAAQADDGAQQVFLVALNRLDELVEGKERAFLCATALLIAKKWKSSPPREELPEELPEVEAHGAQPDEQAELRRNRALLDKVLARLDEELRAVFVLQDIEGLSKRETADALGVPQGTVASRLRRARVAFDALLREDLESSSR